MTEKRRVHLTPEWRLFARNWLGTLICLLALTTFLTGLIGFCWQHGAGTRTEYDWSIPFLRTVQLFLLNSGAEDDPDHPSNGLLVIARSCAASLFLVVSGTVIFRVLDDVRRLPRLLRRRNHVVICGLGQVGWQVLNDLDAQGRAKEVVVVENNPANPSLEGARRLGATIVIGDSTNLDTLAEARVTRAAEVFVVNGDDGVNLEVVAEIGKLLEDPKATRRHQPLRVYAHIVDVNFSITLRPYCKALHESPRMSVQVFNVPRTAAAKLVTNQLWPYAPKETHEVAHFVILGFGSMGQALAVQLAQLGHFPNRKRSRFTIADEDILRSARAFLARYPRFTSWTDGESGSIGTPSFSTEADAWNWNHHPLPDGLKVASTDAVQYVGNAEFVELPAGRSDEAFVKKLGRMFDEQGVKPVVFICGQQDRDNFELAVQIRDQLTCQKHAEVPVFVWLPRQPALADTLSRAREGMFFPFGECRSAASYLEITDPIRESIGKKIHEDYERQATAKDPKREYQPWSALPDDLRESNRVAADHLLIKLTTLGLQLHRSSESPAKPFEFDKITNPQAQSLAEMEHNRWVAERLLASWRYAPEGKTPEETQANKRFKLNPNVVPWSKLGKDQTKDFEQLRAVLRECQKDRFCVVKPSGTEAGCVESSG